MLHKLVISGAMEYGSLDSQRLANLPPYELVFWEKHKPLLDLHTYQNVKVSGTVIDYKELLNNRCEFLHKLPQDHTLKQVALITRQTFFFSIKVEI